MNKTAWLIGAWPCEKPKGIREEDWIIAVDGGYQQVRQWGLPVCLAVGDFDSLGYVPQAEEVIRHPVMKDDTDMMLAIRLALKRGYQRLMLCGGVGGRLDHTMANIQSLCFLAEKGAQGVLVGEGSCMTVISSGSIRFAKRDEGILSVFSLDEESRGVTLEGLLYPLENAVLSNRFPLGVSNEFQGKEVSIKLKEGLLLVIWQGDADWMTGWRDE